ncbi:MAG: hypothetical protein ACKVZJ_07010 [Phycisphaerales bacterium]
MAPSFEEKSVWIQLIAVLVGLAFYLVVAGRLLATGVTSVPAHAALFIPASIAMVVVLVVGHVVAAVSSKPEGRDERDRLIAWKAEYGSSWVAAVGMLSAVTGMALGAEPVWAVHTLLISLCVSELMGYVLQLVYYRRGV